MRNLDFDRQPSFQGKLSKAKTMSNHPRRTFLVNREFQIGLASRLTCYWALIWLAVFVCPTLVRGFSESVSYSELASRMISENWFPLVVSIILFPLVIWDSLRFSNRISGPLLRLNRALKELESGQPMGPVRLRHGDFCQDIAQSLNQVAEQMQQMQRVINTREALNAEKDALEPVMN